MNAANYFKDQGRSSCQLDTFMFRGTIFIYIYIQQCKDEGGGGGHRLHNNRLDITLLGYKSALVYLYPGIINKYWGIINISKLN